MIKAVVVPDPSFPHEPTPLDRDWLRGAIGGSHGWQGGRYEVYGELSGGTALSDFGDNYDLRANVGLSINF